MSKCIKNRTLPTPSLSAKPDNILVRVRTHERSKEVLQNIQPSSRKAPFAVSCLHVRRFQVFEFLQWGCNRQIKHSLARMKRKISHPAIPHVAMVGPIQREL